jgi:hypothetical protein
VVDVRRLGRGPQASLADRGQRAVVEQSEPAEPLLGELGLDGGRMDAAAQHHVRLVPEVPRGVQLQAAGVAGEEPVDGARRLDDLGGGAAARQRRRHVAGQHLEAPPGVPSQHRAHLADEAVRTDHPGCLEQLRAGAAGDQHQNDARLVQLDQRAGGLERAAAVLGADEAAARPDHRPVEVAVDDADRPGRGAHEARRRAA